MKNSITRVLILLFTVCTYAQNGINYKAIIKDGGGVLVVNDLIQVQFTILDGAVNVYEESHTPTTDSNGTVILNIGEGVPLGGSNFSAIDWSSHNHFLNVKINTGGGLTDMGTTAFKTVPFALQAANATNADNATIAESVGTCGLAIGDTYQGGIIFYLDASGCHGLIAAPSDQSTRIQWYNGSGVDTYAYGNGIGSGEGNSQGIRRWQGTCVSCYASELCQDLILGGEIDWYLPSKYELNLMYKNIGQGNALGLGNIGNFANSWYWSSTEYNFNSAWIQLFDNGNQTTSTKNGTYYVRAVRAF